VKARKFGAPLMGLAFSIVFYFLSPWVATVLHGNEANVPGWLAATMGFGIGTFMGTIVFGTLQDGP